MRIQVRPLAGLEVAGLTLGHDARDVECHLRPSLDQSAELRLLDFIRHTVDRSRDSGGARLASQEGHFSKELPRRNLAHTQRVRLAVVWREYEEQSLDDQEHRVAVVVLAEHRLPGAEAPLSHRLGEVSRLVGCQRLEERGALHQGRAVVREIERRLSHGSDVEIALRVGEADARGVEVREYAAADEVACLGRREVRRVDPVANHVLDAAIAELFDPDAGLGVREDSLCARYAALEDTECALRRDVEVEPEAQFEAADGLWQRQIGHDHRAEQTVGDHVDDVIGVANPRRSPADLFDASDQQVGPARVHADPVPDGERTIDVDRDPREDVRDHALDREADHEPENARRSPEARHRQPECEPDEAADCEQEDEGRRDVLEESRDLSAEARRNDGIPEQQVGDASDRPGAGEPGAGAQGIADDLDGLGRQVAQRPCDPAPLKDRNQKDREQRYRRQQSEESLGCHLRWVRVQVPEGLRTLALLGGFMSAPRLARLARSAHG